MRRTTKNTLILALVVLATVAFQSAAQTWQGKTSGYAFLTFTGNSGGGADVISSAVSDDGITWTPAYSDWKNPWPWSNANEAIFLNGQIYAQNVCSADVNLTCIPWRIGIVNQTSGAITTIAMVNWIDDPTIIADGITTCYQGGFVRNSDSSAYTGDGYVHLLVPCTQGAGGNYYLFETHSLPTDMENWSAPVPVGGFNPATCSRDQKAYLIGSTFYIWGTNCNYIQLYSSTALAGPYTAIKTGDWNGWGTTMEGPEAYPAPAGSGYVWYLQFEHYVVGSVTVPVLYYSACSTLDFNSCTWTAKATYSSPYLLRHGTVLMLSPPSGSLPTAPTPIISPGTGSYYSTVETSISCPSPNSAAHYTTDGSTPTGSSPVYTAAFSVSGNETVKALCVSNGFNDSLVGSASYTFGVPQDLTAFTVSDPGGYFTVSATKATFANLPRGVSNEYIYKDFGAGHFSGDFSETFEADNISAGTGNAFLWALSTAIGAPNSSGNSVGVLVAAPNIYLAEYFSGTQYLSSPIPINAGQHYWFKISRSGSTANLTVYANYHWAITTRTITLHSVASYEYFYPVAGFSTGGGTLSGTTENFSAF